MKVLQHFILGVQFLTRIPLTKKNVPCEPTDFKGAMSFFAIIGLIIGLIQYGVYTVATWLMNPLMGALLGTIAGIWSTGGLHLDGLADVFDGFGANQNKEKTLEIMKDSRVGTFGVIAIVVDLSIHFIGMYSLRDLPYLYIWVPVCAKVGVCFLCYIGRNIKQGLGALWIENIDRMQVILNGAIGCLIGLYLGRNLMILGGIVVTLLVAYQVNRYVGKKLGGINGDTLGACNQLIEWGVICYLILLLKSISNI